MSHEITAKDTTLFVREPAWHRLGHVFAEPPESVQAALRAINADFETGVAPVYALIDGEYKLLAHAGAPWRSSDREPFGYATGDTYSPLNNADGFAVMQPLLDAGLATIDTAGTLNGQADVWLLLRFAMDNMPGLVQEFFGEEGLQTYALFANNHCGWRHIVLLETVIRVVCGNTLRMAMTRAFRKAWKAAGRQPGALNAVKIRHVGDVKGKVEAAAEELWGDLMARYEVAAAQYQLLRSTKLTEREMGKLVLDLIAPVNPKAETPQAKAANTRAEARRTEVTRLWHEGEGHTGDDSAWEAYNGLVQALDHNEAGVFNVNVDDRGEALFMGSLKKKNVRVLESLLDAAVAKSGSMLERILNRAPQVGAAGTGALLDSIVAQQPN